MIATVDTLARRMFELVEPIGVIPYSAEEPNQAMYALGFTNYWDTSVSYTHLTLPTN